jgi:hypothetical protein
LPLRGGGSSVPIVRRLSLILVAMIAALALSPATGQAAKLKYHNCDGKKYQLLGDNVKLLRIKMRKSRADGYAPRCLVAEATAAAVTGPDTPPDTVTVYGARWGVGDYECKYEKKSGYLQAQCVHTGKDANTVRFRIVS